jgi:hypothetical protein
VKKSIIPAVLAIGVLAVPAIAGAHGGGKPQSPGKSGTTHGNSHKCKAHNVAFIVTGTVVNSSLTQTAGTATPTDTSDDRFSGTVEITVTHTNHHAKGFTGDQVVTLTNVRASWSKGLAQPNPPAGTRVHLIGKISVVSKKCTDKSAAGTTTFRKVGFSAPDTSTTSS